MLTRQQKAARSPYANWITDARIAAGYSSAVKAGEDIAAKTGVQGLTGGTMGAYESGLRIPHAEHLAAIETVLGKMPEQQEAATSSTDMAALVEQLRRQNDLLAEQNTINRNLVAFLVTSYTSDKPPTWFEVKGGGWVDSIHLAIRDELGPAVQRALASLPAGTHDREAGDKNAPPAKGRAR